MKKGQRIEMPSTRFEKVHKEQEWHGLLMKDTRLVKISTGSILTYVETTKGRVVFDIPGGLLIFIDEAIFDIKNYIEL